MKKQVRVLAVDDAPFSFGDEQVMVVGVVMRGPAYLEAVLRSDVAVDGTDATDKLSAMIERSRYREQLKAVMLDGAALGGFNVVDIEQLSRLTGIPVLTVTRDPPDKEAMRRVLEEKFGDWQERWKLVAQGVLIPFETSHRSLYVQAPGMDRPEIEALLKLFTIHGALPEPLRVAHLIAAGIVRGESRGRA